MIGGISSVITLLDASIKFYDSARNDIKLSETFDVVRRRLPIILDTLRNCKNDLAPRKDSMPSDACRALESTLDACDEKARKLREIFERTIPGEKDTWKKRYAKSLQRFGKGNKVEELVVTLIQDVQLVVNNHAVKSATPEQNGELEDILREMRSVNCSITEEDRSALTFHSAGGPQTNNVNSGSGQQTNHSHFGPQNIVSGKEWSPW